MRTLGLALLLCAASLACGDGNVDGPRAGGDPVVDAEPEPDGGAVADAVPNTIPEVGPILLPQPNLVPSGKRAKDTLKIVNEYFEPNDCALVEKCIGAPGYRKLLRFDTLAQNRGTADMRLGVPDDSNPAFEYSSCHDHYHWSGFSVYELLGPDGVVASGRKQAFCLEDTTPLGTTGGEARYTCDDQGISAGWGDTYRAYLDCQWVDITGVPSGTYTLRITLNPNRVLPESHYDDNVAEVPVVIP